MITDADIQQYRKDGYIVVPGVVSGEMLGRMRAAIADILGGAAGVAASDGVFDLEDSHRPDRPRVRRIKLPHRLRPVFAEVLESEAILGVVTALIGPDVRLQTSKLNMKSAGIGAPVEWHQDWAFYPHTNDDILAIGLMIDDMTLENGPLMVIPGSHRGPVFSHHAGGRFCGAIDPGTTGIDFSSAVRLTGKAGSMTVHHVRLVHGSDLNRSGADRRFLLYELTAADAWPLAGTLSPFTDLAEYDGRMITGRPTLTPRLVPVPVLMPLPKAIDQSSIYAAQKGMDRRYFAAAEGD
jgi:ectoine hydroxylase-related dioxygenase (phytanoyl-CoA dioxygenase family)